MKKLFLLMTAIMMAIGSYGQTGNQFWWGYFQESDYVASEKPIGTGSVMPILTGIYVPENSVISNGSLKGVRIYLANDIPSTVSDLRIWISSTLPAAIENAEYVQKVTDIDNLVVGANDIRLALTYDIKNKPFYIGYYISSSYGYPICRGGSDQAGAFLICAPGKLDWQSVTGYGKLAFQVLVDGVELPDNSVSVEDFQNDYVLKGETVNIPVKISNDGKQAVTSISYTITTDGNTTAEKTVAVNNLASFASTTVNIPFDADARAKKHAKTLTITKVNGQPNAGEHNTATGSLITISEKPVAVPVVEEFTGTWCGWCVYGFTGMEKAHEQFGDKAVLIAAHNDDPMEIADYNPIMSSVASFPSSKINRIASVYPNAANLANYLNWQLGRVTVGSIQANAMWTSTDKTAISIDTQTKFVYNDDNGQYGIAYVLIADGLTGTTSKWAQNNFMSGQTGDATMQFWIDSPSKVTGLEFNHVAVGAWDILNGVDGSVNSSITADEVQNYKFTADISTNSVIQDKSKLTVAALLIDRSTGAIVNASQTAIQDYDPAAIHTVGANAGATIVSRYTLDGRQLSEPQKGVNIVKYSDGRTVKVMVK